MHVHTYVYNKDEYIEYIVLLGGFENLVLQ